MTTNITTPKAQIPVGRVTINGQTFDVQQHPEFVRFFFDLFRRTGGTDAMSNSELESAIETASASEMVMQTAPSQPGFGDIVQPGAADRDFADILQSAPFSPLGEVTWQT